MKTKQRLLELAIVVGMGVALPVFAENGSTAPLQSPAVIALPTQGELPPLNGATQWLNSAPLTAAELRGKVVLVNFWTYSCINSLRQIPYVRAWANKYKRQGLVVIGVHAPEFGFEQNIDNVRRASEQLGVDYPVAIDNDHRVWDAFNNNSWPALYFVDARGHIRHVRLGEGDYEASERIIQQLLADAGAKDVDTGLASVDARGAEAAPDWDNQRTPETYVGYARTEGLASVGGAVPEQPHSYSSPARLPFNHWSLSGNWTMGEQATVLHQAGGRIAYRFHARDLHLVMGPSASGAHVRFRVTIDGKPPGAAHGVDVDGEGKGVVTEPRMYQLIRQSAPIIDHQFEIEFLDPGVETFAFTFG
ncbi:MAG: thioredoxin [Pseudomonas sp.]|nr:thioredoxin [Pseudomonas sp.]